ncbi:MAG: 50S ribosomal protein L17 [Bacilli bacterium]|nr:50S ribosomal protein L17 [Bacilli bacterium]
MAYRKLGTSTSSHRRTLLSNLLTELIMHEKIETTEARAKELRKLFDKVITYAKKGTVEARRDALALLMNDKEAATKAFDELAKRYETRNGGYTRILKLNERRGDDALMVIIELV